MKEKLEVIKQIVKDEKIDFIYLIFSDILGSPKKVAIRAAEIEGAAENGIWFDGSSIQGFARIYESDMLLVPDIDTFVVLPWGNTKGRAAQVICDVYTPEEKPFEGCPRGVLKRMLKKAKKMGFKYMVGSEIEFFLLEREFLPELIPHDRKGYFDLAVQSRAVRICEDAISSLDKMGIRCETYHHEVSNGQHETDIYYNNALFIADAILTLKLTLKTHAVDSGLKLTFMPKPIFGINGSGMHTHQSLADEHGKNLFYDAKDAYNLSETAYHFLAGQLAHARAIAAITNPTVNSYKRLVPGFEAPIYICWGRVNRSALIRVPKATKSRAEAGARLELRCPDPSCNPYLAFAAMLAGGLDGIEKSMTPPKAVEENVYNFDDAKLEAMKIDTLPGNLLEAINELKENKVLGNALGPRITEHFIRAKRSEWKEFMIQITKWEVENYL
jgi:glutamine synthetase